jgi:acyl carrier protein
MDYCAANAFLDAWAHAQRKAGMPVTSVSWDVWQETGMAVKLKVPQHRAASQREHLRQGLTYSEGIEIFRRVLGTPFPHVVVSTRNLRALLEAPAVAPAAETAAPGEDTRAPDYLELSAARRSHERPLISTAFIPPETPVERELAAIWQELLGISPIGVRDNFFELGGHSLLATQVLSRIRATFHIQLPLRALFDAATIADLAAHVANVQWTLQSAVSATDSTDREEFEL